MDLQIINFDTVYSSYKFNGTAFNTRFDLISPLFNVKNIYLKSLEMPVGFCNIRSSGTLNKFSINLNGDIFSIVLPDANYTSISQLCADITNKFNGNGVGTILTGGTLLTLSIINHNVNCHLNSANNISTFEIVPTLLSQYILGFLPNDVCYTVHSAQYNSDIVGSNWYNLNIDNYISLYLSNIPAAGTANNNGSYCSFKVLMSTTNGTILYNCENTTFSQYISLSENPSPIAYLDCQIYDRFGNSINNNGYDYSFSLGFEFWE